MQDPLRMYDKLKSMMDIHEIEDHKCNGVCSMTICGNKTWFKNGKLHREDGPAIETSDGSKYWYFKGKLHFVLY